MTETTHKQTCEAARTNARPRAASAAGARLTTVLLGAFADRVVRAAAPSMSLWHNRTDRLREPAPVLRLDRYESGIDHFLIDLGSGMVCSKVVFTTCV